MTRYRTAARLAAAGLVLSTPLWLPRSVVALRMKIFSKVNGDEGITIPNAEIGPERFEEIYSHPAANGRSKGAALSDLFWYWLSPGPDIHQEHLEAGERYDEVARCTQAVLAGSSGALSTAAARCAAAVLDELPAGRPTLVRLRDLMMPIWASFFYELVFHGPCPPAARRLITDNADDVVSALKCTRPRRMHRRARLTRYLVRRVAAGEVPHELPRSLSTRQRAYYLQGTFFNTAVVQMSEAMAHLLLVLAEHRDVQRRLAEDPADDRYFDHVMNETLRLYPLFGIAHRVTTGDIDLGGGSAIPAGAVLCFSYPDYHSTGYTDPDTFAPERWETLSTKSAHHIPFGVAANRPCPAWRLAPLVMRAVTREVLGRYRLDTAVSHTRSLPHRGPCLLVPRERPLPSGAARAVRGFLRVRDRCEDVVRAPAQLVLGTWMVLDARRRGIAATWFATHDTEGNPLPPAAHATVPFASRAAGPAAAPTADDDGGRCPFPH
ncbi:cytochrome P450 [Streptomyces sp. TS71-3]|uniref:cytochrome P450 n=1 Tax=Streptomyces sp. TS71-3 TaxID=2733862 RepID=UPI001B2DD088|nr:cytochrome P450 [Streptomyces sp. TS71-3]GHJ38419.1 cytochrome P450 [Streptomyces sp. TS71-3]